MKQTLLLSLFATIFILASCKKNNVEIDQTIPLNSLSISNTFDWSTTNAINFSVANNDARFNDQIHVIYIYDLDPSNGGTVLAKGSSTTLEPFKTKLTFANGSKSVYVIKSAPDGSKVGQTVQINSSNLNLTFNSTSLVQSSIDLANGGERGAKLSVVGNTKFLSGIGDPNSSAKDSDGDLVNDNDDDYPNDKTKSFKNYSVNYKAGGSTLAFEDNWPQKGDYDFNDVVIKYRYLVVSNAKNLVTKVEADYTLVATGATYINGFGVQFPIKAGGASLIKAPAEVSFESKQDSLVLIVFKNSRELQSTWNTKKGEATSPVVNFSIEFNVLDSVKIKDFGTGVFNPFIWNTDKGRGHETHLIGKSPTKLASGFLFNSNDDASLTNKRYYSTKNNLPWAIEIPIADFYYPIETVSIDKAYSNFSDWATSSGLKSNEWYKILSGGTVSDLIYKIK